MVRANALVTAVALAGAILAGPALAETAAARAVADILIASDLADMCPEHVRRKGPQDREGFITEGVRVLMRDGHTKAAIYAAHRAYQGEDMYALMRRQIAARGVDRTDRATLCRFGASVAGRNDRVGRFLTRVH